ncbi:hypothetical protein ABK040_015661 [Willaertia magna]
MSNDILGSTTEIFKVNTVGKEEDEEEETKEEKTIEETKDINSEENVNNKIEENTGDKAEEEKPPTPKKKKKKSIRKKKRKPSSNTEEPLENSNTTTNNNNSITEKENRDLNNIYFDLPTRPHYLSVSNSDIIVQSNENEDDGNTEKRNEEEINNVSTNNLKAASGVVSKRNKVVFFENAASGQFRRERVNDLDMEEKDSKESIDDTATSPEVKVDYRAMVVSIHNNFYTLFLFSQGLLSGFCLLHVLINIPFYTSLVEFATFYSKVSIILQKFYMALCSLCLVLSAYILSIEIKPPLPRGGLFTELLIIQVPSHRKYTRVSAFMVKLTLGIQVLCYFIAFICSIVMSSSDEYMFWKYSTLGSAWATATDQREIGSIALLWIILNVIRAFFVIIGWISAVVQKRILRRQSERSFQYILAQQQNNNSKQENNVI